MHRTKNKQNLNSTPYGDNFDRANKYDYWILAFSLTTTTISLFTYLSNLKGVELSQYLFRPMLVLQIILAVLSVVLKSEQDNQLEEAYKKKIKCELDSGFDSKLSPSVVQGYFDTGPIPPGYKRLLAITHENALFTGKNSSRYHKILSHVTLIFVLILILFIVQGVQSGDYSLTLLNFIIGSLYVDRLLSSKRLSRECALITNECIHVIESWETNTSHVRVIDVFVSYENLLSATKVNIDPRIHKNNEKENNEEWNKVFARYYSVN